MIVRFKNAAKRLVKSLQAAGPNPPLAREYLAAQYIRGNGIEVGALNAPLKLPTGAKAKLVDYEPEDVLEGTYPELKGTKIHGPDIISDLESLQGIEDASQDFVIANHVLEHVEDPIRALKSVSRVLKTGGIAYLAVPEKTRTFDHERKITPLEHFIRDHEEGPDVSAFEHYLEWAGVIEKLSEPQRTAFAHHMLENRTNIHFHVWDVRSQHAFFHHVTSPDVTDLNIVVSCFRGNEVIWILCKR